MAASKVANFCLGDVVAIEDFHGLVVDTELVGSRYPTVVLAWRNDDGWVEERRFSERLLLRIVNRRRNK